MTNQLDKVENYVFNLFKDKLSFDYTYHNFIHTISVVEASKKLISFHQIDQNNAEIILLAAWFHDTGYTISMENHEKHSAEIAYDFLSHHQYSDLIKIEVKNLILNTEINSVPETLSQKIIRDADSFHLGHQDYFKIAELLRTEIRKIYKKEFSDLEWHQENRAFFIKNHRFYSDGAKSLWQDQKDLNLIIIQNKIAEIEQVGESLNKFELKKKKNDKALQMDRGVDTLFRVTLNNHTRLSDIADSKANILLSVNAIIISIALSTLIPRLGSPKNEFLIIPSTILLLSSVCTIIFAILSTKPKVTYENFTDEDVKNRKVNLLFFGNFHQMELDNYTDAMSDMMKDRDFVYNSLTRDLYYLGKVLDRKYKLLSITYTIFMIGIILSVFAFIYSILSNTTT